MSGTPPDWFYLLPPGCARIDEKPGWPDLMLLNLLKWLDSSPSRYGTAVDVCFVIYLALSALPLIPVIPTGGGKSKKAARRERRARKSAGRSDEASSPTGVRGVRGMPPVWRRILQSDTLFFCSIGLLIFAGRWPFLFYPRPINPDEATFVADGITLWHDPVFWRSVSAGTSGALNVYVLLVPKLLGFAITYTSTRIVGLFLVIGTISFLYAAARQFMAITFARLAVLPLAAFFALTISPDFIHYSSEHVPLFLLAASLFGVGKLYATGWRTGWMIYLTGAVIGAAPFAKLQAIPLAATIGMAAFLLLAFDRENARVRAVRCGILVAGGVTVAIWMFAMTSMTGALTHFLTSYVFANVTYARQGMPFGQSIGAFPEFFARSAALGTYIWTALGLGGVAAGAAAVMDWKEAIRSKGGRLFAFGAILTGVAIYSAAVPGRHYVHYLLFLVVPVFAWSAAGLTCFDAQVQKTKAAARTLITIIVGAVWAMFAIVPQGLRRTDGGHPVGYLEELLAAPPTPVGAAVRKYGKPGEPLAVWGWMGDLFVQTGMWRAARDSVLEYAWIGTDRPPAPEVIEDYENAVPRYFQDLFMSDVEKSQPAVFVDAVSPAAFGFHDRALFGYETFPPLAAYVSAHYRLVEEVEGARIFLRTDTRPASR